MTTDTAERYGSMTKFFHWSMAFLIGWQLLKVFDRINDGEHWVGQTLVPWHISIGTLLLVLIVVRLIWVLRQRTRPLHDPATAFLVKAGHGLLFAGMLVMPVTGILKMLGGGYGLAAFGIQIVAKGDKVPWMSSIGNLHSPIAWAFAALIAGHIVMALHHHFVRNDDALRRMI